MADDLESQIQDRHYELLVKINGEMRTDGPDYENLIEMMKALPHVGSGALYNEKSFLRKLQLISRKGHLAAGNYVKLKKLMERSQNISIIPLIDAAQRDIEQLRQAGGGDSQISISRTTASGQPVPMASGQGDKNPISPPKKRTCEDSSDGVTVSNNGLEYYNFQKKKGYVLILEFLEQRTATENDSDGLRDFFGDKLNFIVVETRKNRANDLNLEEFNKTLEEARSQLNGEMGKSFYCFICVILSHGSEQGIRTQDGKFKSVEDIRKEFANDKTPGFIGKPKVFMIQACRGPAQQEGMSTDDSDDDEPEEPVDDDDKIICLPRDADTLLAFATTPGYVSTRRKSGGTFRGSWFIQKCLDTFRKDHDSHHLEDMLITVRDKVAQEQKANGGKQMPCVWSTLTKRLLLKRD